MIKKLMKYTIPAGTCVNTRNLDNDLRLKRHTTRQELQFEEVANTGDGGLLYYFVFGDWLIAVNANHVITHSDSTIPYPMEAPIETFAEIIDIAC